jgi:hypothetical protein
MLMQFGKHKGLSITDVPLNYLKWWKTLMINDLKACSEEISRREDVGITEDVETKLSMLPEHIRLELLQRLFATQDEDQRAHAFLGNRSEMPRVLQRHRVSINHGCCNACVDDSRVIFAS